MAATVVVIRDEKEWEIVSLVLSRLEEGGIIIPPEKAKQLDEKYPDWGSAVGKYIEYDFGGEPDILVDVVRDKTHADNELCAFLEEELSQEQA